MSTGMPNFDMNSHLLQQMGGMPSNYLQMVSPQSGMMQMMMPNQHGQQSLQGNPSMMPVGFPFSGMMGNGTMPQSYANLMGNNPFYSMAGMSPGGALMMSSANTQSKSNDQAKAAANA
jgi:lipid-binding SYLF domain-containing protein